MRKNSESIQAGEKALKKIKLFLSLRSLRLCSALRGSARMNYTHIVSSQALKFISADELYTYC